MGQSTSRPSVRQGEEERTACKEEPKTQPSCRATVLILTTPGRCDTGLYQIDARDDGLYCQSSIRTHKCDNERTEV